MYVAVTGPIGGYSKVRMHPASMVCVPIEVMFWLAQFPVFLEWYESEWENELVRFGVVDYNRGFEIFEWVDEVKVDPAKPEAKK